MNIDTDKQYQETTVEAVESVDGGWDVKSDDGWHLFVTSDTCNQDPRPGESMRTYGRGFGYEIRGIAINGRVYRYRTETEAERDRKAQLAKWKSEKVDGYEAKRADFGARVAALPEPFRLRIERFRNLGGDQWRYEFEPYELFTCEQAIIIAEAVGTVQELQRFRELEYDEQRARVPKLDDGHSGNTFGVACNLAHVLLERPELLPKAHGAMCGLVGCKDYGCFAGHEALRGIEP